MKMASYLYTLGWYARMFLCVSNNKQITIWHRLLGCYLYFPQPYFPEVSKTRFSRPCCSKMTCIQFDSCHYNRFGVTSNAFNHNNIIFYFQRESKLSRTYIYLSRTITFGKMICFHRSVVNKFIRQGFWLSYTLYGKLVPAYDISVSYMGLELHTF